MIDYKKVIKEYGTPLFIYDIDKLLDRVDYLKSKLGKSKLVYAIKANTFIVKEIDKSVDKFEICSPGEFEICRILGIDYKKMVISGVNKDKYFIDNLIKNYDIGRYTFESIEHFNIISESAKKHNKKVDVLIRLTSGNQFGVSEGDFKYIIEHYDKDYINICGLEFFSGTQKHSIKKINREIDYINEFINTIKNEYGFEIKEVEYGPGLPVSYYESDDFDEEEYFKEFKECLDKINSNNILIETGRSVCASCGEYLTSVVDIKENQTGIYAIVDGGINHLVYYGGTLAMKTPPFEVLNSESTEKYKYNVYGSLCTINDVLLKSVELNSLSKGDTFIFKKVGAYSSTEGISLFLSRDLPKILLKKKSDFILIRDIINTYDINCPNYRSEE